MSPATAKRAAGVFLTLQEEGVVVEGPQMAAGLAGQWYSQVHPRGNECVNYSRAVDVNLLSCSNEDCKLNFMCDT